MEVSVQRYAPATLPRVWAPDTLWTGGWVGPGAGLGNVCVRPTINLSTGKSGFISSTLNFWFYLRGRESHFPKGSVVRILCFNQIFYNVCEVLCFGSSVIVSASAWDVALRHLAICTQIFKTSMLPGDVGHQHPVTRRHSPEKRRPQRIK